MSKVQQHQYQVAAKLAQVQYSSMPQLQWRISRQESSKTNGRNTDCLQQSFSRGTRVWQRLRLRL